MHVHVKRSLLSGLAMLTALAVAAPANASLTPSGAAVTGSSANSFLGRVGTGVSCPRSNFSGRIAAGGGSATGDLTFGGRTCTERVLGTSCTVTGRGNITITVQSSVAGTSASGRSDLNTATYTIDCPTVGIRSTINRARQNNGSCLTYTQATATLTAAVCSMVDDAGGLVNLNASYVLSPRVTVS